MIAGRPPFDGDSVTAVMMKIVQDEPAPDLRTIAPDTPATLAAVVRRALEKASDDRYADAAEMAADLRAVRVEIADQEEPHAELTTTTNVVPEVAWKRAHLVRDEEAPKPAATLLAQRMNSAQGLVSAGITISGRQTRVHIRFRSPEIRIRLSHRSNAGPPSFTAALRPSWC